MDLCPSPGLFLWFFTRSGRALLRAAKPLCIIQSCRAALRCSELPHALRRSELPGGPGRESISQSLHDIRLVRNTFPPGTSVCVYPFQFTETGEELLFGPSFPQYGSELHHSKGRGKTGFPPSEYRGATGKSVFARHRCPQPNPNPENNQKQSASIICPATPQPVYVKNFLCPPATCSLRPAT